MVQREIRKKTQLYGTVAILSAIVLISFIYVLGVAPTLLPPSQAPAVGEMKTFSSAQEIANYLNTNAIEHVFPTSRVVTDIVVPTTGTFSSDPAPVPEPAMYWMSSVTGHSTTNIQVTGVDEVDTVKTDGQYIYLTSDSASAVYIIDADPENPEVVSKIVLDDTTQPAGLFLSQDSKRLVVLASKYSFHRYSDERWGYDGYTFINVYDISNKAHPSLTRNFTMSGNYFNSRMIGDNVYTIVSQPAVVYNNIVTLPAVYEDNRQVNVSPTCIYYTDMDDTSFSFTSFYALNIDDDTSTPANMTVMMGGASTMYVSTQNFYVTYPVWDQTTGQYTAIYRAAIDGLQLTLEAQGSIPGSILNQYSMDEYNGNFRVATNYYGPETQISNIYVLDADLTVTGKLEGLAPNENLHSVRFMGDKGYLVTFKAVDPLFIIDLGVPSNPKVLGELKIPGYSDYLHPYDETHLIGIGKETTESATGDFAWYHGLKLSLFDVSNVNKPVQLTSYGIGDRGTDSEALRDPHAFLFDKERNLLVIPVNLALINNQTVQNFPDVALYGETVWQGAYVFSLSLDGGFILKDNITHLNPTLLDSQGHLRNINDFYATQNDWITHSLYIDNILYTVSNSEIKLTNLTDMTLIATINLPAV
ncbi:MAG: beta-propeller domain-containing protein [Nitrososphaerota archaeon]|nr:beta-propeller domain-containing protein [Nitrososphaerota archaeon]